MNQMILWVDRIIFPVVRASERGCSVSDIFAQNQSRHVPENTTRPPCAICRYSIRPAR
jgi:hypothetical protein